MKVFDSGFHPAWSSRSMVLAFSFDSWTRDELSLVRSSDWAWSNEGMLGLEELEVCRNDYADFSLAWSNGERSSLKESEIRWSPIPRQFHWRPRFFVICSKTVSNTFTLRLAGENAKWVWTWRSLFCWNLLHAAAAFQRFLDRDFLPSHEVACHAI